MKGLGRTFKKLLGREEEHPLARTLRDGEPRSIDNLEGVIQAYFARLLMASTPQEVDTVKTESAEGEFLKVTAAKTQSLEVLERIVALGIDPAIGERALEMRGQNEIGSDAVEH